MRLWEIRMIATIIFQFYFNSKRCDYESHFRPRLWMKMEFQFQKVRLWVAHSCALIPIGSISIPKGAIMRISIEVQSIDTCIFQFQKVRLWVIAADANLPASINFNSKRCDYEQIQCYHCQFSKPISIPKGAIMSVQQTMSINSTLIYFNSKRCDYEKKVSETSRTISQISIPKGAIMRVGFFGSLGCRCCISIPKGAIMSRLLCRQHVARTKFQFQKVRLWVIFTQLTVRSKCISIPKGAIMRFVQCPLAGECFEISIPKGAIMSTFKLTYFSCSI